VGARVAAARAPSPCRWEGAHLCHVCRHARPRGPGGGGCPNRCQRDDARPGGWQSATATGRRASPDDLRRWSRRLRGTGRQLSPSVAKREPHLRVGGTIFLETPDRPCQCPTAQSASPFFLVRQLSQGRLLCRTIVSGPSAELRRARGRLRGGCEVADASRPPRCGGGRRGGPGAGTRHADGWGI